MPSLWRNKGYTRGTIPPCHTFTHQHPWHAAHTKTTPPSILYTRKYTKNQQFKAETKNCATCMSCTQLWKPEPRSYDPRSYDPRSYAHMSYASLGQIGTGPSAWTCQNADISDIRKRMRDLERVSHERALIRNCLYSSPVTIQTR